MGKRRRESQEELFVAAGELAKSPGHVFYQRLNKLLAECGFDEGVEKACQPYYDAAHGRGSIPPGTYFRMLFIGYFEAIESQRVMAWRCADRPSLRETLGVRVSVGARAGVPPVARRGRRAGPAEGEDVGGRFDDARSGRGHAEHRP